MQSPTDFKPSSYEDLAPEPDAFRRRVRAALFTFTCRLGEHEVFDSSEPWVGILYDLWAELCPVAAPTDRDGFDQLTAASAMFHAPEFIELMNSEGVREKYRHYRELNESLGYVWDDSLESYWDPREMREERGLATLANDALRLPWRVVWQDGSAEFSGEGWAKAWAQFMRRKDPDGPLVCEPVVAPPELRSVPED